MVRKISWKYYLEQKILYLCLIFELFILSTTNLNGETSAPCLHYGDNFPDHPITQPLLPNDYTYLGLSEGKSFKLSKISAELLLVELLNKYCYNCQVQAPLFNKLYQSIENDPALKNRVKIIGIAVGNNQIQVDAFKKEKFIPFPILPDPDFKFYKLIGEPKTPFTLLLRKNTRGEWIIASTHLGIILLPESLIEEVKAVLKYDIKLIQLQKGKLILNEDKEIPLPVSDAEILNLIRNSMKFPSTKILKLEKIILPINEVVYQAELEEDKRIRLLFAKVVSQKSICDVCHDLHFIYIFDDEGKIINFIPIHLTKYGNKEWDKDDLQKISKNIIGTTLKKEFIFNPELDAISSATITTLIIYYRLNHGKEILEKLKSGGYIK